MQKVHCAQQGCGFSDPRTRQSDAESRSKAARKLAIAITLCIIFMAVEIGGGIISHSLAILTDATHLLSDVASFAISLFAIWASGWKATPKQTYGFFRLEILGALMSIQIIWLLTGIIVYEAVQRIIHYVSPVNGKFMFIVATVGVVVNLVMMLVLGHGHGHSHGAGHGHSNSHSHDAGHGHSDSHSHGAGHGHSHSHSHRISDVQMNVINHGHEHQHTDSSHEQNTQQSQSISALNNFVMELSYISNENTDSVLVNMDANEEVNAIRNSNTTTTQHKRASAGELNIKGAWLHVIGDLIQSIGVMIGGAIIWIKPEWQIVDLICTLLFSLLVLWTTINLLREVISVLMESTPRGIDAEKLEHGICQIPGVVAVHELHIWAITTGKSLLACHVTIQEDADANAILQKAMSYCDQVFNINHVTIQIEKQTESLDE